MYKQKEFIVPRRLLAVFCFLCLLLFSGNATASEPSSGIASVIPWSGWWWPFKTGGLATGSDYRKHPAPLEKYLLLTTGRSTGLAIDWYMERYYDKNAGDSWGLCPAYARAAINESYPILPSVHDNIVFRVGDKKGLLTLCYDDRREVTYASGNNPVEFHFWLLDYIGKQKKAFAADLSTGDGVWYHPVYAYEMETTHMGQTEDVSVTITYAAHMPDDYMGTFALYKPYYYTLDLDAAGNVTGGRWTGTSVTRHPNMMSYVEKASPLNPYLEYEKIREIAQARDDAFEMPGNEPARLVPGHHNLVLLNKDVFTVEGKSGDSATLEIIRQDGSNASMLIEIADSQGVLVHDETLFQRNEPMVFALSMTRPPYTITISQENYATDPNIYSLYMDFHGAHVFPAPYIPLNGPWSGFSITNASDQHTAEIMLVMTDKNNRPLQTVDGPMLIPPGQKYSVLLSSFPLRKHELKDITGLKVISDQPVEMVHLFANTEGPLAGFSSGASTAGSRIIIPDIYANDPGDPFYMTGAISNESFVDAVITCSVYSMEGALTDENSQNIAARGLWDIRPGISPFYDMPHGGWIEIVADDPEITLSGYQYLKNKDIGMNSLETSFALQVVSGTQYVQHVTPPAGPWQTLLTLINPNADENPVRIHPALNGRDTSADSIIELEPFEKRVIDISTDFAKSAQRSILEISGRYPLSGYAAYGAKNGDTASYSLLNDDSFKTELIMPHAAYNKGRWYTGVGVCNPSIYSVTVLVLPYDKNGRAMDSAGKYLTLDPGAYKIFTVHKLFSGFAANISFLKIRAVEPDTVKIGGFYLYGNSDAQSLKPREQATGGNM